jgi:cholera toxin transcriptional activator
VSQRSEATSHAVTRGFRFGQWTVDVCSGELTRNRVRIRLQNQPFELLLLLLQRAGEVVTRDELERQLWPAGTFIDFEHGLNAAVKRLRAAIGDSAARPTYVQTLPRRGYRFIAPVEPIDCLDADSSSSRRGEGRIDRDVAEIDRSVHMMD